MSLLIIVPARSGSKGLPGKNIRNFLGKPLMSWTITAAIEADITPHLHINTDSREYASIAESYGAKVPFLREESLAGDHVIAADVYKRHLELLKADGQTFDHLMVLLPTCPMRTAKDIQAAWHRYQELECDALISVYEAPGRASWLLRVSDDNRVSQLMGSKLKNRQDEENLYFPNGAIYIFKTLIIENSVGYYDQDSCAFIMDRTKSIDIDTEEDFRLAEVLGRQALREVFRD